MDIRKFALMFMIVFMISSVSAMDWDNRLLTYDIGGDYPVLKIENWLGFGSDIAMFQLEENTEYCLIDCYAIINVTLYDDMTVFDDVDFINKRNKRKYLNYNIYYEVEDAYDYQKPIYEEVCSYHGNGTAYGCYDNITGYEDIKVVSYDWRKYKGKVMSAGNYKFKIEAKKDKVDSIDWSFGMQGISTEEIREYWAWWDTNWKKKKEILVQNNVARVLGNFSVLIDLTYDTDMKSDFSDIRFLDQGEQTELSYYIKNKSDSTMAQIEVKIPILNASINTSIYMYYGNAGASTTSNGTNVYLIFDDFSYSLVGITSGNNPNWNSASGTWYANGSDLRLDDGGASWKELNNASSIGKTNISVEAKMYIPTTSTDINHGVYTADSNEANMIFWNSNRDRWEGGCGDKSVLSPEGTWRTLTALVNGTSHQCIIDGVNLHNKTISNIAYFGFGVFANASGTLWDYIIIKEDLSVYGLNPSYVTGAEESLFAITLDYPANSTYAYDIVEMNYTADATSESCWYSLDGGSTNTSIVCGVNVTGISSVEGSNTWLIAGNDSTGISDYSTVTFNVDTTPPVINFSALDVTKTIGVISDQVNFTLEHVNVTDSNTGVGSCGYFTNNSYANVSINCNGHGNLTLSGYGNRTLFFWSNDTVGNGITEQVNLSVVLFNASVSTASTGILEGETNIVTTILNSTECYTIDHVVWNNTWYGLASITSQTTVGNAMIYVYQFPVPLGVGNESGRTVTYAFNYSACGGSPLTSATSNQQVYNASAVGVDDCSVFNDTILNISLFDEGSYSLINNSADATNIELDLEIISRSSGETVIQYYNQWINMSNVSVCLKNSSLLNHQVDMVIGFDSDDRVAEFYHMDNGSVTSAGITALYFSKILNLSDLASADSTSFLFNYLDSDGLPVTDSIIHVWRKYVGSGVFREVERSKQDENGDTVVHLVEEDVIYYFTVSQYNQLLFTSSQYTALCQELPCTIEFSETGGYGEMPTDFDLIDGGYYTISSDPTTRQVSMDFVINTSTKMNISIYEFKGNGTYNILGSNSTTNLVGSLNFTIPQQSGNTSFFAVVSKDDEYVNSIWVDMEGDATDFIGYELALFLTFLIVLCFGLIAVTEGGATIVFVLVGLFLAGVLGLADFTTVTVNLFVYILLAGGIILYKLNKK